jgi:cholesterol transport system auxiliary component
MRTPALIASFLVLGACAGPASVPPTQYYVLGNGQQAATAVRVSQRNAVLLVHPTSVSAFYDTQRLVYSRAEGQRSYYQFAAWTERPGRAFSELLVRRLGASSTTSGVKGNLVLRTQLHELYHDASTDPGAVKIEVSAELVDAAGRLVGEPRRFSYSVPTRSENAAGAVEAANRSVSGVLDEIAAWVQGSLGFEPSVEPTGERPHLADAVAPK